METNKTAIELHYWKLRGLFESIKTLCEYLNVSYTAVYKTDRDKYFSEEIDALRQKGFDCPNLPYLKDGDLYLSQSFNLHCYVVKKANRPDMTFNEEDQFIFFMRNSVISDIKGQITTPCYTASDKEALKNTLQSDPRLARRMDSLYAFLSKNKFVMGDKLTFLDFILGELLEMMMIIEKELEIDLFKDKREVLENYVKEFLSIEAIVKYRKTDRFFERPFNNPVVACWF